MTTAPTTPPSDATRRSVPQAVPIPRVQPLHRHLRAIDAVPAPPQPAHPPDPAAGCPADEREVAAAVNRILRSALEALDGRRPLGHVARHLDPSALRYWRAVVHGAPGPRAASRLQRVIVGMPGPHIAEVAAVCVIGGRPRALAARFESAPDSPAAARRWRCTVLRLA